MTERVYLLKNKDTEKFASKFYTSPYSAVLAGERLRQESPDPEATVFVPEMFVLDIEDVPCDHTIIKDFVKGFINKVHLDSYSHKITLLEEETCMFQVLYNGDYVGTILVLYVPPSADEEDVDELGYPVFRVLDKTENDITLRQLETIFVRFCEESW